METSHPKAFVQVGDNGLRRFWAIERCALNS
jgi:hypothetical protein